jgi:Zn-dependent M28 family amino/carboxypeptidase
VGDAASVPEIAATEIAEHMRTLASDEYLGRGPGHVGGEMAAEYIARRFGEYGLEAPAGSYLQPFPIIGTTPEPSSVSLSFTGPDGSVRPTYLDDFVLRAGDPVAAGAQGEAELVFVGYGINAPETGWDDFAGTDVTGKYVMILVNDPPAPPTEPDLFGGVAMTYYGRWTYKYEEAARQGALGALVVHETGPAGYPWSVVRGGFSGEQFALPPDPAGPPPPAFLGWVSLDLATAVLAAGGHDFDDLKARAGTRGFTAIETGVMVQGSVDSRVRTVETQNVAGLLRGSTRPDEYILVTSHYDHFGIGETIEGDSIYNGAYDNASGTGLILAMARALSSMERTPERSIVFIATGAEEQGLLGAEWYVQAPLYPLDRTVAEVNFDGANLWGLTSDVIVQGEERSELGAFVRARAAELGLTIMPDAEPQNGYFFRSDHFPFAKAGVPSLYVEHGRQYVGRPEGWGADIQSEYTARYYHAPSDEFRDDFVFDGAVQQGTLGMLTVLDIAADQTWPNWHEGQEFKAARDAMMTTR